MISCDELCKQYMIVLVIEWMMRILGIQRNQESTNNVEKKNCYQIWIFNEFGFFFFSRFLANFPNSPNINAKFPTASQWQTEWLPTLSRTPNLCPNNECKTWIGSKQTRPDRHKHYKITQFVARDLNYLEFLWMI